MNTQQPPSDSPPLRIVELRIGTTHIRDQILRSGEVNARVRHNQQIAEIKLAFNPKLRVLIRDASLLDQDNLRLIGEMAAERDAQVWLERVEVDDATTIVIEDGEEAPHA
jgi:hypothetical protein